MMPTQLELAQSLSSLTYLQSVIYMDTWINEELIISTEL